MITSLLLCALAAGGFAQSEQTEPRRYAYKITGKVIFSKSQPLPGATVYVMPSRPISGRIPFAHADKDGRFLIEFRDVADKYRVCAHPGETGGLLPLAPPVEEAKKMQVKTICTKTLILPAEDSERKVLIRLRAYL